MIERVFTYSEGIQSLCSTSTGLWIAHNGGLSFLDPDTGAHAKWTTAEGIPAQPVLHLAGDSARLALATPNGIAWTQDAAALLRATLAGTRERLWQRGLCHPRGAGAYLNGVAFVDGRIHAATGGGRLYREGAAGFELIELPLPQARLMRLLALECAPGRRRLLLISNNNGVLLLATGAGEEPSLFQWSEEEGLSSRYVTAVGLAGEYVVVGVHGCVHVARCRDLVERPQELTRWGRVALRGLQGPAEHGRVYALAAHGPYLYAGTSAGLFRLGLEALAAAADDMATAERLVDLPVRHLVPHCGELWCVQHNVFGKLVVGGAATPRHIDSGRGEGGVPPFGRHSERPALPRITTFTKSWRLVAEPRWRVPSAEPESHRIACLAATPEGIVCGGDGGRVLLESRGRWSSENVLRQRRSPEVHSVVHDPESDTLWAATRHGLFVREAPGRWSRDLDFPGRTVHQLVVWQGNLLVLGSAGLHSRAQGAWSEVRFPGEATALFLAAPGDAGLVLAGRPGAGYFFWAQAAAAPESFALPVGRANCMAWDEQQRLWIGTDRGFCRWQAGHVETQAWNAEAEDHVTSILVHAGRLYVGSHAGVWNADVAAVDERASPLEARGQRLGVLEGLPHAHVTSLLAQDERVWAATQCGLASLV